MPDQTMMNVNNLKLHVISNTHWDREWRQSFQRTRMALIDVMDQLLDILENDPDYKCYHLDSQTVLLEDYLEVKPQKRSLIERFIREGRILAGPWYSNPDMNQLTGESIVRNMLLGHKIAKSFGKVMKVGYNPFSFGQISQLPQIYKEFGMDVILFYRGVGRHRAKSEFWWVGADGTRALASQLSWRTRHNFYYHVYQHVCEGIVGGDRNISWSRIPVPAHVCHHGASGQSVYTLDHVSVYRKDYIKECISKLIEEDSKAFTTQHYLLMQGCDTTAPNPLEPQLIRDCNEVCDYGDLFHSTLEDYVAVLKESVTDDINILHGEMREALKDHGAPCLGDVISSRIYLKQRNAASTMLLEKIAEPFSVSNSLMGGEYPQWYIDKAWQFLLQNHAHDSIAGCSVDQVHKDMLYRFDQCDEICDEISRRVLMSIVKRIDGSQLNEDESLLTIFNPLAHNKTGLVRVSLDFDKEKNVSNLKISDEKGRPVQWQFIASRDEENTVQLSSDWPQIYCSKRIDCYVKADNIPSCGYKSLKIRPSGSALECGQTLLKSQFVMENEYVCVKLNNNGTVDITERSTGRSYQQCNYFEDSGECGHSWTRMAPRSNEVFNSLSDSAEISMIENGPLRCTFQVDLKLYVPESGDDKARSEEMRPLVITSQVSLNVNSPLVEFETKVVNDIRNHRLRACFPTRIDANSSYAESAFDVVERPIKKIDHSGWRENFGYTHPKLTFVDVSDGVNGFAFIGNGIPEYEVLPDKTRTVAVTLLRSIVGRRRGFGFPEYPEEGPQCLGTHDYKYAIMAHAGQWHEADVLKYAHGHSAGFYAIQSGKTNGVLPLSQSFWSISPGNLVLSCIKYSQAGNGVVVRVYNPCPFELSAGLTTAFEIKQAQQVTMEEIVIREVESLQKHSISFKIPPKKVFSFLLSLESGINS
jgi:mannosylglycerate hydrolase